MKSEKINIRGVMFDNVTMDEADALLRERFSSGEKTAVFTPNSEIVQSCIDHSENYDIINSAELIVPDGIGVIKAANIIGTPLKEKVAGFDLGLRVLAFAAESSIPVFFFGGVSAEKSEDGISAADAAAAALREKLPGLNICGCRDGYCKKEGPDNDDTLRIINESGAEILFVCLGAPAQEKWISANRDKLPGVKIFLGLGGSLDGYSGRVKRAPKIFISLGLEWFYRLLKQPSRIGRMMSLPKFYFGTWRWKLKNGKKS